MTTEDPVALAKDAADRELRVAELKARIGRIDDQLLAMTDEAEAKRAELRVKYRELHDKRYSDVDYKRALVGSSVEHAFTLPGLASYFIAMPNGLAAHNVEKFIVNPMVEENGKQVNLAPISNVEAILLAWLVGIHLLADPNAKRQDLKNFSIDQKIKIVRQLPENLASRIAEECTQMQSWLNTILEIELGKS